MKKALIALSLVLAFSGVSFAADAAAPAEKPAAVETTAAAPAKKVKKVKKTKKTVKKAPKKDAAPAEKKAE